MEEETCETCLNFVLAILEEENIMNVFEHLGSQIEMIILELNLLKMFFQGLAYLEHVECDLHLRFAVKSMMHELMQIVVELAVKYTRMSPSQNLLFLDAMKNMPEELRQIAARYSQGKAINSDVVMYDIGKKIDEQLRPEARDVCILLLGCADYNCTSCPPSHMKFSEYIRDTTCFMDLIFQNLKAILNSKLIAPVMKQHIGLIQGELKNYGMFVNPIEVKKMSELISSARTWFSRISCLTYLYWSSNGKDGSMTSITMAMISGFLHQNMHVGTYGAISSKFQPALIPQLLARHLDFLLGGLVLPMKDCLQEELIFMLSFIIDPPDVNSKDRERIWAKIYATFNKFPSLIYSIRSGEMKDEICKANISDFLLKVDRVKAKVSELFLKNPYSSLFTAPNTNAANAICFLNSLIVNLNGILKKSEDLIPSVKHLCETFCNELESFQLDLKSIMKFLECDRYKEMKDVWKEMINMVYNVDYSTKLFIRGSFFIWWYGMIALPDAIENTKLMRIHIKQLVGGHKVYNKKRLDYDEHIYGATALRTNGKAFESERTCMGFIEDENIIINKLLWGPESLTIVSISGSGGQGKTTLAKRIYDDLNVRHGFQTRLWIYVSKDCKIEKLLVQILSCDNEKGVAKLDKEELILRYIKV